MSTTRGAASVIASAVVVFGLAASTNAQTTAKGTAARTETAAATPLPQTAPEHLAMAETYGQKAVTYRTDAAAHRQMLEAYKKQVAVPMDQKAAVENPWIKKMRTHRESYIRAAEGLAGEAEALAECHRLRAHETEGK